MSDVMPPPVEKSLSLPAPAGTDVAEWVPSPRLGVGDRIERFGVLYEFREKTENGKKFVRVDTGAEAIISNIQLIDEMQTRAVRLAPPPWLNRARSEVWNLHYEARTPFEKHQAEMRFDYVEAFVGNRVQGYPRKVREVLMSVHRNRMVDPKNREAGETVPSLAAVYEWLAIWDKAEGKQTKKVFCFAESRRGPRGPRITDEVSKIFLGALRELWYTPQRHKVRTVWDRVVARCLDAKVSADQIPCMRTLRRAIGKLPPYAVAKARLGARAADLKYLSVGQLNEAVLPGQVYEVDAHKLDLIAVDDFGWPIGRLWVTCVIDRKTRMIVGFHLHVEPPSSITIAAALRHAFAPKLYMQKQFPNIGRSWPCWGLCHLLVLDNGLENKAVFLTEALTELGVVWKYAEPRTPEEKPYIERFFRTYTSDFTSRLPGWTGAKPGERGDYDSEKMACIDLWQADALMHEWIMIYNTSPHTGINDVPLRLWYEVVKDNEVTPIEDYAMLDVLLGDFAIRTVSPKGIYLLGLRYGDLKNHRPLEAIRTRAGAAGLKKVRIRFDRTNLAFIYVQDPVTKEYFPLPSLEPEYTDGMTLARHRIIRARAVEKIKGFISIHDLCQARDELQKLIDKMTGHEPISERRFASFFNGIGSKGSWYDFYRLAEIEYGKRKADSRPVVALLETDEGLVQDPDVNPSAAGKPEAVAAADAVSADKPERKSAPVKARVSPKAKTAGLPKSPEVTCSQNEHSNQKNNEKSDLSARAADLGIDFD
jgi:putative transposase